MSDQLNIAVGTLKAQKIEGVKVGFKGKYPGYTVTASGIAVPSGVSDQPIGIDETRAGARNRAWNCLLQGQQVDFYAGSEGGLVPEGEVYKITNFVAIIKASASDKVLFGEIPEDTEIPKDVIELINNGKTLSQAVSEVYNIPEHEVMQNGTTLSIAHHLGIDKNVLNATEIIQQATLNALNSLEG